ncbi:MAG: peptidoglycan recognition family protein [Candidatus Aminicenantes bacterium]
MRRFAKLALTTLLVTAVLLVAGSPAEANSLKISDRLSPLNAKRPVRPQTRYIVLHTTEGGTAGSLRKVRRYGEAHYFVTPSGEVYRIIDRRRIATHAGRSMWEGRSPLDNYSLGIEVVGYCDRDLTAAQYAALKELLRQLKALYRISDKDILTHSMVAYGRPNRFHPKNHRGRKRCGMIFSRSDVRRRLGIGPAATRDADVEAGRLAVADPELHRFLYAGGAARPAASLAPPVADGGRPPASSSGPMVISKGVNAWRIARDKYDDPATIYIFPNGTRLKGNEVRDWDRIPAGTRVEFEEGAEREQDFEGFQEIGKDGRTLRDIAGDLAAEATTIYFFPSGLVRTGAELARTPSLKRLLQASPAGTRVLVGYIYGGHVRAGRPASRIAGRKWNYPSTFYRLPNGRILSGDEVDDKAIPARTLIFMLR